MATPPCQERNICDIIPPDLSREEGILLKRGICPRVSGEKKFPPLSFLNRSGMEQGRTLSVFVDESGRFLHPDAESRFYIMGMVFHDQNVDISNAARDFDRSLYDLGLDPAAFVFHTGPLVRREKGYEFLTRHHRGKIYNRMMTFARRIDFKWHCLCVDKKYINSSLQIVARLQSQLDEFIDAHKSLLENVSRVKVYYDCGQSPITKILQKSFRDLGEKFEFASDVRPGRYKLFQLADLICTLYLVATKIKFGERLTDSEYRFFGGPSAFRRCELKFLAAHALP